MATGKIQKLTSEDFTMPKSVALLDDYELWIAYWRKNPHRFVREYLHINCLKPFQEVLLFNMMETKNFMYLASRGQGKTFITALFVVVLCILYPGTKIIIAAGVKSQAMKIISEKIPELMGMSDTLRFELSRDIITNMASEEPNVQFLNGSWIKVTSSTENARSAHCNVLVLDEFRMIDIRVYQNTLRRLIGAQRQPGYLTIPEYSGKEWVDLEKNRQVLLSSAYYKHNWAYDMFKTYFGKQNNGSSYMVIAYPYQKAVEHNLLSAEDLQEEMQEDTFNSITFSMEMGCMFFGESEHAFYTLKDIEENRQILKAIYPTAMYEKHADKKSNLFRPREKEKGEIRIISVDVARVSGKANDASAYALMSLRKDTNNKYRIYIEYMETMVGGHSFSQATRIRQLYADFNCDYIVIDIAGNTSVADALLRDIHDKERDVVYPAFRFMNNDKLNEDSLDGAKECMFGVRATSESNMSMARAFRDAMKQAKVKYLTNTSDAMEYLVTAVKDYAKLSKEEQAALIHPYIQIDNLVNEIIGLELRVSDTGVEKLAEPRSGRKDRYSCVLYGSSFLLDKEKEFTKPSSRNNLSDFFFCT